MRKITNTQKIKIADLYKEGMTGTEIARRFNVSTPTIYAVLEKLEIERRPSRSEFRKITPKQVDEAIQRYQDGELLSDIAEEFGVTYYDLSYHLSKHDIKRYPNGYQMRAFMPVQDEEIRKRYDAGENIYQLADAFGAGHMAIKKAILRTGRKLRSLKIALKQYSLNENAFSILDHETAYWIGFIMADGCLIKRKKQSWVLAIDLQQRDQSHLQKLAKFLSYDGMISKSTSRNTSSLKVSNDVIVNDLMKWGLAERKSLCEKPNLVLLKNPDFWRGEVDGDGSIYLSKGYRVGEYVPVINLTGGEYLVNEFSFFVKSFTSTKAKPSHSGNGLWKFTLNCQPAIAVIQKLYADCDPEFALKRKLERATKILEQWPNGYDGAADHKLF